MKVFFFFGRHFFMLLLSITIVWLLLFNPVFLIRKKGDWRRILSTPLLLFPSTVFYLSSFSQDSSPPDVGKASSSLVAVGLLSACWKNDPVILSR
jgi:hypothetical protein